MRRQGRRTCCGGVKGEVEGSVFQRRRGRVQSSEKRQEEDRSGPMADSNVMKNLRVCGSS